MQTASASAVLNKFWDGNLPVNVDAIAQRLGIEVRYENLESGLNGYVNFVDGTPVIHVNADDARVRQRFTIAHEIGHFVLGHVRENGRPMLRDTRAEYSMDSLPHERAANKFAASLLMPAEAVRFVIGQGYGSTLSQLTNMFGVSREAMQFRARNLGIIQ